MPTTGGIWRQLPHEATRQEFDRGEAQQREVHQEELKHPHPSAYIERSSELRLSGMDEDQVHRTTRRDRGWSTAVGGKQRGQARATPGQALYARYKTEKAIALGARKQAEQAVYDRFAGYQQQLSGFYNVQHEQQKLAVQRGSERHKEHEVLSAGYRGDRVQATTLRARALAVARRDHPLPTWDAFLARESERGDREASRILQQRQERQHGRER